MTDPAAADAALALPVWDLPVRLVHWALVALIAFSWWSAENGEIEWHVRSGLCVLFLLLFRLLWGFFGSSTARFSSFVAGPRKIAAYIRDPAGWRGVGHSPLGALSVVALLGLIALQVWFGLPLSDEDGVVAGPFNRLVSFEKAEWAREVHEVLFNVLLALIGFHIAAIVIYHLYGKLLIGPMVFGSSDDVPPGTVGMVKAPLSRLILCLGIAGAVTAWLWAGVRGL